MLSPVVKIMKKNTIALALILFCSVLAHGQVNNPASKNPAEWSLSLKTGGAPWTKKFEVELNQAGKLLVTEQNPDKTPDKTISKINVNLSAKDTLEVYEHALKAFREFRFAAENAERADGTNLTLRLSSYGRVLVMQFFHIGQMEEENPNVAKVLSLINKHLSQEHQVY